MFITVKWSHLWACVDTLFTDKNDTTDGKKGVGSPINPFNLSALFLTKLKTIKKKATKDNDINLLWVQWVSFSAQSRYMWWKKKLNYYMFGVSSWCWYRIFRSRSEIFHAKNNADTTTWKGDVEQLPPWGSPCMYNWWSDTKQNHSFQ